MRFVFVFPANALEFQANGTWAALGVGTDVFRVGGFPAQVGVTLLAAVAAGPGEVGRPHEFVAQVLGPDLDIVVEPLRVPFQVDLAPGVPDGWEPRTFVPMQLVFEARSPGVHSIELRAGDATESVPLWIAPAG